MHIPLRLLLLLSLCLSTAGLATAGEPVVTPAGKESPLMRETRQYLAQVTEERNQLRQDNDTLTNRQGLLAIYGGVMTLLAAWLMLRHLRSSRPHSSGDTDVFPAGGTTTMVRKNATITIRNSNTQQAEVTERVQTRQTLNRGDTATHRRQGATTRSIARTPTPPSAAPALAPVTPARPAPSTTPAPAPARAHPLTTAQQRPTVRIEQHSDRLDPVEVAVKPGTGAFSRTTGR